MAMRIAIALALFVLPATSALAENNVAGVACKYYGDAKKLNTLISHGDKEAAMSFVIPLVLDKKCGTIEKTANLRVDESRGDYRCIAERGTPECRWMHQDYVNLVE